MVQFAEPLLHARFSAIVLNISFMKLFKNPFLDINFGKPVFNSWWNLQTMEDSLVVSPNPTENLLFLINSLSETLAN